MRPPRHPAWSVTPVLLLVATAALAAEDGLREGESVVETPAVYPGAEPLDADGEPTIWAVRIVDAATGEGIAGARVSVPYHWRGGVAPDMLHDQCAGVAGADGWVRLPRAAVRGWDDYVFADATGYAANEYCNPYEAQCELVRGRDVPVVLLDYLGRPVPRARLALNLGCGHVPDQRRTTTDASGRAVFRDIDPSRHRDIWIDAPGIHRGTVPLGGTWRPGSPPVEIHGVPGEDVVGRILDRDGEPLARVLVGARGRHRPWTWTDAGGRFRLRGVAPWSAIGVALDEGGEVWFRSPPAGVERTFRVGEATGGTPLLVQALDADGRGVPEIRVIAVREADGATTVSRTDAEGAALLHLAPGRYRVLADGELGAMGRAAMAVVLGRGESAVDVTLVVPRNPVLRVDAARILDHLDDVRVGVTTARAFALVGEEALRAGRVPVPSGERAAIRVSGWEDDELLVRFFAVPPDPAAAPPLVLDWLPVTRVTARLVDAAGRPLAGRLRVVRDRREWSFEGDDDGDASRTPFAETRLVGVVDWVAIAGDAEHGAAHGTLRIAAGGGESALGDVVLPAAGGTGLRVVLPPHLAGSEGGVEIRGAGDYAEWAELAPDGTCTLAASLLREGEQLRVVLYDHDDVLPLVVRGPGPVPSEVEFPAGVLRVTVRGEDGEDGEEGALIAGVVVLVDGELFEDLPPGEDGALTVRGLADGPHEVIVAGRRRLAKVHGLRWDRGEMRTLRVQLAPRPQ